MKARQCEFDNRLFRSRLEMKWAAFFLSWGTPYDYEPERYGPEGLGYLPDFRLPVLGLFLEVKPASRFGEDAPDIRRAVKAAPYMPSPLWFAYGEPIEGAYLLVDAQLGTRMVLAHCRRCHALSYLVVEGRTMGDCWHNADDGGTGWGQLGGHTCGDHDRQPEIRQDDALRAAYENGRKLWFLF